MNTTTATPVEVDTELATLETQSARIHATVTRTNKRIKATGHTTDEQAATLATARRELDALAAKIAPLADRYRTEQWNRAFLVLNNNGHVHATTNCHTCTITTEFAWLTQCSGMTTDDIVAAAGEHACTVCYPDAPSAYLARPCTLDAPERAAAKATKAADKARKDAEKAKKAITNPDGTELCEAGKWGNVIKTEVAASRRAVEALFDLRWYSTTHPSAAEWTETAERCTIALAHKHGRTVEHERAELAKKTDAKYRRESR